MGGKENNSLCQSYDKRKAVIMDNLINFIMSGQTDFTPETLIRFVVFVLILSCISSIAQSVINVNK